MRTRLSVELLEDRSLLSHWTAVGPAPIVDGPVSGRITGIAAHPTEANIVYIAAAGGGVWKTTNASGCIGTPRSDARGCWTPLTDDIGLADGQHTLVMGAIAVAPMPTEEDPHKVVIYAGTGEANNSGDSFYGRGVLISPDGGDTWRLSAGNPGCYINPMHPCEFDRRTISKIVVHPTNPMTVYVAVSGNGVNGLSGNGGIWKSTDGGMNWNNTTPDSLTNETFSDLVIDPTSIGPTMPAVLYAAVGGPQASPNNGVYKSPDGGMTWAPAGNFPFGGNNGRIALAIAPSAPQTLYASVIDDAPTSTGRLLAMLRSTNAGMNWIDITMTIPALYRDDAHLGKTCNYDIAIAVHRLDPGAVYVGGQYSILRTLNGTAPPAMIRWDDISDSSGDTPPHVDHHALVFDASNVTMLDGNDGGIWRLENPLYSVPPPLVWRDLTSNLQITQFVGIATHPTEPNILYGGSQDNGTVRLLCPLPSCVDPDHSFFLGWRQKAGGDGGWVRVNPVNPNIVYRESPYDDLIGRTFSLLQRSSDGGDTWVDAITGISGTSKFYAPYVMDPTYPSRLIYGADRVFESLNDGRTWAPVSPNFGPIDTVALSPTNFNTIYASARGRIYVTFDHGLSWTRRDALRNDAIARIVVNPFDDQIAYAVSPCFNSGLTCLDTFLTGTGHVFMTMNGGMTWSDISGPGSGFPDLPTWSFVVDPGRAGQTDDYYYAGTDDGVYVGSSDPVTGAVTWQRLADRLPGDLAAGLPRVQVHDLEWNANLGLLTAGTYGRGLWQIPISRHSSLGPDAFGYSATVAPFEYNEILGQPGTFVVLDPTGLFMANWVDLGADTFTFYDTRYTGPNRLVVGSGGVISFGFANYECDDPHDSQPYIAPLCGAWVKDPGPDPMVLGRFENRSDGRVLVIEWYNVRHALLDKFFPDILNVKFQAVLYLNTDPNSGKICFNYGDLRQSGIIGGLQTESLFTEGRSATVGIKATGFQGPYRLLVSYNNLSTFVGTQQSLCFTAPPPGSPSGGLLAPLDQEAMAVLAASTKALSSRLPMPPPQVATTPSSGTAPPLELVPLDHLFAVPDRQDHGFALRRSTLVTADGEDSWLAAADDPNGLLWDGIFPDLSSDVRKARRRHFGYV